MSARVPETMRAAVIDRFGGPEELHLAELPTPRPGPGEALVRVAYASVNPADWKCHQGWLAAFFDYRFPFVVGFDAAGVAAASKQGKGAGGSYAEHVVSDVERVVAPPPAGGFAEAASLPTAGMTAWEAVFELRALVAARADGRIRAPALDVLPLERAGDAHRRVQAGHVRGKLLLRVAGDALA